jgi:hypothetical protein
MKSLLPSVVGDFLRRLRAAKWAEREKIEWRRAGKPLPAPACIKHDVIKSYAKHFGCRYFLETGTYLGDTVYAMRRHFLKLYSIEIDPILFHRAELRFSDEKKIALLQGDSATELPKALGLINEPCVFWLDGHWSGGITGRGDKETPILEEFVSVLGH